MARAPVGRPVARDWERVPAVSAGILQRKARLKQPRHVLKHPLSEVPLVAGTAGHHSSAVPGRSAVNSLRGLVMVCQSVVAALARQAC